MSATLLPIRLSICGVRELDGFAEAGVSDVLSILDPEQPVPDSFQRYAPHRRTTLRFDDVVLPSPGHAMPAQDHVAAILEFGERLTAADGAAHLLVHCYAGVSRSTAAAAILMAQRNPGRERDAFMALIGVRPRAWPNSRMVALADDLLARRGRLRAGLDAYYREAVKRYDGLADYIRSIGGRGHEVPDLAR
ncbi:MAG: tyrosine phosphatase family protein [Rhodospirillales bacterium]